MDGLRHSDPRVLAFNFHSELLINMRRSLKMTRTERRINLNGFLSLVGLLAAGQN